MQTSYVIYALLPIIAGTLTLVLGYMIYRHAPKLVQNRTLSIMCLGCTIWLYSFSVNYLFPNNPKWTLFIARFAHIGVNTIWAAYLHFTIRFLKLRGKVLLPISYGFALILTLLTLFTNLVIPDVYNFFWGAYPKAGLLYPLTLLYALCVWFYCVTQLYKGYKNKQNLYSPEKANRVKYVFWAFFIGNTASIDYMQDFGIEIYPFGCISITIFATIMAYAILRHQLLDINIVIKKSLVYSISIALLTALYLLSIFSLEYTLKGIAGYRSSLLTVAILILFVLIFHPLKNQVQRMLDKYFFHGSIDQIDEENIKLRDEVQKTEKLKAIATLAAGMAHEIKNPLTSIKTFTEYMPQKGADPKFRDKFQKIVGSEVDKINNIVKQLLEFSKPRKLLLKEININILLDETLNLLNNDFLKTNIKFKKHYTNILHTNVDPSQMKQVFLNLFLNAKDAIKNDGTITVTTEQLKDNLISIAIADTGIGISKEDLKHIFDPFFTKKDTGTGLGLSVVHGIIEKHGGKIDAKSIPKKGTSFTITLPT